MPDQSTVEIYIWPWETRNDLQDEQLGVVLEENGIDSLSLLNCSGDAGLEVEVEEVEEDDPADGRPWLRRLHVFHEAVEGGSEHPWWVRLAAAARGAGLAYLLLDHGHHAWDACQEFWLPGLSEPVSRPCLLDGAPVVRLHDLARLLAETPSYGDVIDALARLAGSRDPLSWRPGKTAVGVPASFNTVLGRIAR